MEVDSMDNYSDNGCNRRRSCRIRRSILSPITTNTFHDDDMNCSSEDDFQTDGDSSYCGSLDDNDDFSSESDYDEHQQSVKLSLKKRVQIIQLYDQEYSIRKLAKIFHCDRRQINNIITNRSAILKTFEEHNLEAITTTESEEQQPHTMSNNEFVEKTSNQETRKRSEFPRQYKAKTYFQTVNKSNDNKAKNILQQKLSLEQSVMVIKSYNRKYSYQKLARNFNCSVMLIASIIKNRETILKFFKKLKHKKILEANKEGEDQISNEIEIEINVRQNMNFDQSLTIDSDEDDDENKTKNISLSSSDNENPQNNFQARKKLKHDTHKHVAIDCENDDDASDILEDVNVNSDIDKTVKQTQESEETNSNQLIIIDSDEDNKDDDEANAKTDKNHDDTQNKISTDCDLLESVGSIPTNTANEETNNNSNTPIENIAETYLKSGEVQNKNNFNKLSLQKCEMVINCYDSKISYENLARNFSCSVVLITSIIENRDTILKFLRKLKHKRILKANKENNDPISNEIEVERNIMELQQPKDMDCNETITVESNEDGKQQNNIQAGQTFKHVRSNDEDDDAGDNLENLNVTEIARTVMQAQEPEELDCHQTISIESDEDDDAGDNLENLNITEIARTVMQTQEPEEMNCQRTISIESDEDDEDNEKETENLSSPSQQNPNNVKNPDDKHNNIMADCDLLESVAETNKNTNSPIQNIVKSHLKSVEGENKNDFNKLSLQQCVMLINCYDRNFSFEKLAPIFNCSVQLIRRIIKNRDTFFNFENILENLHENSDETSVETEIDRTALQTQEPEDKDCSQTITPKRNDDENNNEKLQNNFQVEENSHLDTYNNIRKDFDLLDSDDDDDASDILENLNVNSDETRNNNQTIIIESDDEDEDIAKTDNLSPSCRDQQNDMSSEQQNDHNDTHNEVILDCYPIESVGSSATNCNNLNSPKNIPQSVVDQNKNDFNKLTLQQCAMVIKCYDRNYSYEQLANIFKCSTIIIKGIIKNRDNLLNSFRKVKSKEIVIKKELNETMNEMKQPEEITCNTTIIVLSDDDDDDDDVNISTSTILEKQQNDSATQQPLNCDPNNRVSLDSHSLSKATHDLNKPKDSISHRQNSSPKCANINADNEESLVVESSNESDSNDSLTSDSAFGDLSLENRVKLIKAHDKEVPFAKLVRMFKCSFIQFRKILENRDAILKAFAKAEKHKKIKSIRNYLSLHERVAIIEAVDRNVGRNEICRRFNCARNQIIKILTQREGLLNLYKESLNDESSKDSHNVTPNSKNCVYLKKHTKHRNIARCNRLNLDERIGVIKAHSRKVSEHKLACIFNCSDGQISNIILKRKAIIEDYKELYPDLYENDKELQLIWASNGKVKGVPREVNILPLHKRIEVIKAYEQDPNFSKLSRWFECSKGQIIDIIKSRDIILNE